ncbi:hypothetical protein [Methylobacterium planeticum]|uniref:hypothetical protein n=1 Tax=Methylobacterium planeticum TaxID=2615211 RepID=UPI00177DB2B0|nr:hypothetical protein [Methylobacterium planeticum]
MQGRDAPILREAPNAGIASPLQAIDALDACGAFAPAPVREAPIVPRGADVLGAL